MDVLVATAESDRAAPVAFDVRAGAGSWISLRPPRQPVIALGRAETGFRAGHIAASTCITGCDEEPVSGGNGGALSSPRART